MFSLTLVLLAVNMQLTSYRSEENQTDGTPYFTSTQEHVHKYGVAASRDLLCPMAMSRDRRIRMHSGATCGIKKLHYGDWLYLPGYGLRVVNDTMNARHRRALDLWVATKAEEKQIGTRHTVVFVVKDTLLRTVK